MAKRVHCWELARNRAALPASPTGGAAPGHAALTRYTSCPPESNSDMRTSFTLCSSSHGAYALLSAVSRSQPFFAQNDVSAESELPELGALLVSDVEDLGIGLADFLLVLLRPALYLVVYQDAGHRGWSAR